MRGSAVRVALMRDLHCLTLRTSLPEFMLHTALRCVCFNGRSSVTCPCAMQIEPERNVSLVCLYCNLIQDTGI